MHHPLLFVLGNAVLDVEGWDASSRRHDTSSREGARVRWSKISVAAAWSLAAALPLIGLASLLLRSHLDPAWDNHRVHFALFLAIGIAVVGLALATGDAAERRGDARVFLLSLAFLTTGGFLALHAVGTPAILITEDLSGFKIAISAGLVVAALFMAASAFVDVRPSLGPLVVRHRHAIRLSVFVIIALWVVWTLMKWAPLSQTSSEGATGSLLAVLAAVGAVVYAVSAGRYWFVFRNEMSLLAASVIACCILLGEAMIGVAVTGERNWHASWWEWHALIIVAFLVILFAARREWRDERFRRLYLSTTRERLQEVSVLFGDLAGYTSFSERAAPHEIANMLGAYYAAATPLIGREFGGEVEKFMGDGIMVTFNSHGDQPDHAMRAARAALALQQRLTEIADTHPSWPRMRIGVNTGEAVVRELGGSGYVQYAVVGDVVNTGSRLEGKAPIGAVLIGAETYQRLPGGTDVEPMPGLHVKGKELPVDAYVLHRVP
jgi:class 3 adenylate cyclase